ncbi:2-succinyl-6-hydroxy-2,4-cyclohexadiene-1-carboxylate synthase [Nissabacter sp. SGAir0207]|uniref:2-succinyl-6-hydroxy-2, 4-cyclohexadiene-1-carboxylate synthase n=1 Tax=Nissabacter sp. SGAir0207 TaxID=2126321 RepID=UPI00143D1F18|nr:2-succinyl-6-hydroxy-2,4-cyclohexadiene-1-carboxylate synthase [Nissabacter sp. SGAir0207]
MLAAHHFPSAPMDDARPWLVFLHGLLGSAADWQAVAAQCHGWRTLALDLPGHGASAGISPSGFAALDQQLRATLRHRGVARYWLVGYSLGGRVAMYHATRQPAGLCGLVVEGGHPGLMTAAERQARLAHDQRWAQRLLQQPLETVLDAWYRQPVFADLAEPQRQALIALRRHNAPAGVAQMLLATSLGHQPPLDAALARLHHPFHYLCGGRDSRFRALAEARRLPLTLLAGCGHNAHFDDPGLFTRHLISIIDQGVTHDCC